MRLDDEPTDLSRAVCPACGAEHAVFVGRRVYPGHEREDRSFRCHACREGRVVVPGVPEFASFEPCLPKALESSRAARWKRLRTPELSSIDPRPDLGETIRRWGLGAMVIAGIVLALAWRTEPLSPLRPCVYVTTGLYFTEALWLLGVPPRWRERSLAAAMLLAAALAVSFIPLLVLLTR